MSADDALMARFFASYVSPSERPRLVEQLPEMSAELKAFVDHANALAAEPVLPDGLIWDCDPPMRSDRHPDRPYAIREPATGFMVYCSKDGSCRGMLTFKHPELVEMVLRRNGLTP